MRQDRSDGGNASFRVVFDTNVYLSAFRNPNGVPARIFRAGVERQYQLIISPSIIQEYASTSRKKFGTAEKKIQEDIRFITHVVADIIQPDTIPDAVPNDSKDNHILACALAGRVGFVISGDQHLLTLKEYEGIVIERPVDFLRTLGLANWMEVKEFRFLVAQ